MGSRRALARERETLLEKVRETTSPRERKVESRRERGCRKTFYTITTTITTKLGEIYYLTYHMTAGLCILWFNYDPEREEESEVEE